MRAERNIVTVAASSLLRESDFGSAQSLPANMSQTHSDIPRPSGTISAPGDGLERYIYL